MNKFMKMCGFAVIILWTFLGIFALTQNEISHIQFACVWILAVVLLIFNFIEHKDVL